MTNYDNKELGSIRIAPEALQTIAKLAVMEVEGVTDINTSFFGRGKEATQGIKVTLDEEEVTIDLSINIKYGYSLPKIANAVQSKVKESIEQMAGVKVVAVNVFFSNIELSK